LLGLSASIEGPEKQFAGTAGVLDEEVSRLLVVPSVNGLEDFGMVSCIADKATLVVAESQPGQAPRDFLMEAIDDFCQIPVTGCFDDYTVE
jgi:hypothetical protein